DLNIEIPFHGELTKWAKQGVLLINAIFSVEAHKPSSHKKLGWQNFTDSLITRLSEQKNNLVFILWGNFAQSKAILIDTQKHLIIKSAHPSPLSAYNGFWDSKPYSKANEYLQKTNQQKINWEIPIF
ncbi:MAG: uracil-DNA glycosylase, partial [Bacteroidales bacterium]|nr:uracil-DNA glycosylase [Bacteroidales bacterium]